MGITNIYTNKINNKITKLLLRKLRIFKNSGVAGITRGATLRCGFA